MFIDLCQKDFGNEWLLATGNEMNSDRISMGAQAWYNSGSPNEPKIRYGYPKNYYAKPDNPWSIANYINESTDEMNAMCIKPDSLEFINHAFQNGWLPDKNGLYKSRTSFFLAVVVEGFISLFNLLNVTSFTILFELLEKYKLLSFSI